MLLVNSVVGTFSVTVVDTTTPVLTLPADITAEAVDANGAPVSFTTTAPDTGGRCGGGELCMPAPGSTFGLGTTAVNCEATDAAGNAAVGSFNVIVVDTDAAGADAAGGYYG